MQHKSDNGYVMQKVENEMAGNLYTVQLLVTSAIWQVLSLIGQASAAKA